jgi:hypothetical protein
MREEGEKKTAAVGMREERVEERLSLWWIFVFVVFGVRLVLVAVLGFVAVALVGSLEFVVGRLVYMGGSLFVQFLVV